MVIKNIQREEMLSQILKEQDQLNRDELLAKEVFQRQTLSISADRRPKERKNQELRKLEKKVKKILAQERKKEELQIESDCELARKFEKIEEQHHWRDIHQLNCSCFQSDQPHFQQIHEKCCKRCHVTRSQILKSIFKYDLKFWSIFVLLVAIFFVLVVITTKFF